MLFSLSKRSALVCGSSRGIGKATAIALAEMGASITLFSRNEEALAGVRDLLDTSKGQRHKILLADFNKSEAVSAALGESLQQGNGFDILINNTGGPPGGPASEATHEEFRVAFERHLIVSQLITTALLPGMKQRGFGRIVNIISTSVKAPIPGLGVSNTIRGAVANWAKTLSAELGPYGITVNNILPGATMTDRLQQIIEARAGKEGVDSSVIKNRMLEEIPARRFAEPRETAIATAFLCSEEAGYINGINLPVDGGRLPNL